MQVPLRHEAPSCSWTMEPSAGPDTEETITGDSNAISILSMSSHFLICRLHGIDPYTKLLPPLDVPSSCGGGERDPTPVYSDMPLNLSKHSG
ncbi:hypothetical protein NQ318_013343 [Aromia moschata]|uniref:Uncharacterized protein n=1 Tax=Aromia moschata TaxID=1265417 RepID=A0AAV8XU81_9CUCU|nr:hypothetical protein NQ318_013343 [Aromia moschata]